MNGIQRRCVIGLACAAMLVGCSEDSKQRQKERRAIDYCESQAKERERSVQPAVARFMYSTCQMMRDDFRAKWRREP